MNHQPARLRFDRDGLITFAEYDGSADQIQDRLYLTWEALREDWRGAALDEVECHCGRDEPAVYAESYADGSYGPVRACRHCLVVTSCPAFDPHGDGYASGPHDGLPDWWE